MADICDLVDNVLKTRSQVMETLEAALQAVIRYDWDSVDMHVSSVTKRLIDAQEAYAALRRHVDRDFKDTL